MRRVAFIGLDAVEPTLVESMLATGDLPNLAALRARGAWGPLSDPRDFRTGIVWEQFLTGRGSASSGRRSAVRFEPASYATLQEGASLMPPFYDTDPPTRVLSFDVPYTSLIHDLPGTFVTGWGGHDPGYPRAARPAGLLREIDARFGHHPAFNNDYACTWYRPDALERQCAAVLAGARLRADVVAWLAQRDPDWELLLTVLSEGHSAGEQLWHGIDPQHPLAGHATALRARHWMHAVYRAVDDTVGRIAAALPPDVTLVVASLHGVATNAADLLSMALLPELLYRWQCGEPRLRAAADPDAWRARGCPPLAADPERSWLEGVRPLRADVAPAANGSAAHFARLRARLHWRWQQLRRATVAEPGEIGVVGPLGEVILPETRQTPREIGVPVEDIRSQPAVWYRDAWPHLRAFALPSFYDGRVRVNLAGREAAGIVAPGDYARTCEAVADLVRGCRDVRTGKPVVDEVVFGRADDPCAPGGPESDVEVRWAVPSDAIEHPELGLIGPLPFRRPGGHSPRGFVSVTGRGIAPGALAERDVRDVSATILGLLDRRPRHPVEGRPLAL